MWVWASFYLTSICRASLYKQHGSKLLSSWQRTTIARMSTSRVGRGIGSLLRLSCKKNPHQTVAAANAHVLSKSRTSVRSIACAFDDERRAAYDSGDRTGIGPTRWVGSSEATRPYLFQGTLHQVDRDVFCRSVAGQEEAKALRMASGKFVISSAHGLVSAFTKNGLRIPLSLIPI